MCYRRMAIANLSAEGYGIVRRVKNVGVTIRGKFYSTKQYERLLDKIITDPFTRANL